MGNKIQDAVANLGTVNADTISKYGKPEEEFIVRITSAEFRAIDGRMMFNTLKMRVADASKPNPYVKKGYEVFLLKNEKYRKTHLSRAAYLLRSTLWSDFPLPTDKETKGLPYINYCRKIVSLISVQLKSGDEPIVCMMEMRPFDKQMRGYGMRRGYSQRAIFKPLLTEEEKEA